MRVMQVIAGAKKGGAETFFERLVAALAGAGVDQVAVIRADAARRAALAETGVAPVECRFGGPLDRATPRRLRRLIAERRPDLILTWMNRATAALPATDTVHAARLGGYYKLKYYRRCDHLIGNTPGIVGYLRQAGWPSQRTHFLPNFPPNFRADRPRRPLAKSDWQTPEDAPVILALGRLHDNKGHDVLIKAMADITGAHAWIAGDGPREDDLRRLARETGVAPRVHFLGWQTAIADLMATADLLAFPSRHEPLGNVILEAFAYRVPVVATRSQGADYLIDDGRTGLIVEADAAEALAGAINDLLQDPERRRSLAAAAHQTYQDHFSQQSVVQQYVDFFDKALAAGKK